MTAEGNRLFQTCRAWSRALRAAHLTWEQIATVLSLAHPGHTPLQLHRLAHGRSAADITGTYNSLDPAGTACLHVCRLYDWEAWPAKGRRPTPAALTTLARIYQTTASNLITRQVLATYRPHDRNLLESTDFSYLDPFYRAPSSPAPASGASMKASAQDQPQQPGSSTLTPAECTQVFRTVALEEPDMKRRDLLVELALALGGIPALTLIRGLSPGEEDRLAQVVRGQGRVDADTVTTIETLTARCRRLDDTYGPAKVLPVVKGQSDMVSRLLETESLTPGLRARLTRAYAELAQLSGFLSYDRMHYVEADGWFVRARDAALETDDPVLVAYIHSCQSEMASFRSRPLEALDHAMAAQGWARRSNSNLIKAQTEITEAMALARNGRSIESLRRLDHAMPLSGRPTSTEPSYLYWIAESQALDSMAYWIHGIVGRAHDVIQKFGVEPTYDARVYSRQNAIGVIHYGTALVQLKEIPEATAKLSEAATILHQHSSARLGHLIAQARQRLEPWAGNSYVRDLDDRLLAAGVRWSGAPA